MICLVGLVGIITVSGHALPVCVCSVLMRCCVAVPGQMASVRSHVSRMLMKLQEVKQLFGYEFYVARARVCVCV